MRTITPNPVDKATIIRTAILAIALLNQLLVSFGYSPLPIDNATVELIVSSIITAAAALLNWWKNNAITYKARQQEKLARQEGLKKK